MPWFFVTVNNDLLREGQKPRTNGNRKEQKKGIRVDPDEVRKDLNLPEGGRKETKRGGERNGL